MPKWVKAESSSRCGPFEDCYFLPTAFLFRRHTLPTSLPLSTPNKPSTRCCIVSQSSTALRTSLLCSASTTNYRQRLRLLIIFTERETDTATANGRLTSHFPVPIHQVLAAVPPNQTLRDLPTWPPCIPFTSHDQSLQWLLWDLRKDPFLTAAADGMPRQTQARRAPVAVSRSAELLDHSGSIAMVI